MGMWKHVKLSFQNYYTNYIIQMVEIVECVDKDLKKTISHSVYSSTLFSVTEKIIISTNSLSEKVWTLIENVDDQLLIEKSLNIFTLPKLIPHLLSKLRIVERVIFDKFYDSQSNTDVDKIHAKNLCDAIKEYFSDTVSEHLAKALQIWGSKRLIAIGSVRQNDFLTYLIRHLMLSSKNQNSKVMSLIKDGIKNRLDGDISNVIYAHIIWDTLAEGVDAFENRMMTPQQIQEFDSIKNKETIIQEIKINKLPEEEKKVASSFYDENDSDNDSDFEGFVIEEDDAKDIKFNTKPTHLYDLVKGLQSEDIDRYHLSLESANEVIRKNLPNLDVMLNELLQILFRTENKFSKDDFEDLKSNAIRAWLYIKPAESASIFFKRLSFKEASIGHKIKLLGLMQDAFRELADSEYQQEKFEDKANSYSDYAEEFKSFFEVPHIETDFDKNMKIVDQRIEDNTTKKLSYYTKQKEK